MGEAELTPMLYAAVFQLIKPPPPGKGDLSALPFRVMGYCALHVVCLCVSPAV